MRFEQLEDRRLLAIVWSNRGDTSSDTDDFTAVYGADADAARLVVDQAILSWNSIILDFNFDSDSNPLTDNTFELFVRAADLQSAPDKTVGPTTITGGKDPGVLGSAAPGTANSRRPTSGGLILDDDGSWFIDTTPGDHSEFTRYIGAFALEALSGAASMANDMMTTAMHEIGHALGFSEDLNNGSSIRFADFLSDLPGSRLFYNPNGQYKVSAFIDDDGAHTSSTEHVNDLMNSGLTTGARTLISDLDVKVLADAYGWTIVPPLPVIVDDSAENNGTIQTATILGSPPFLTVSNLTIDDGNDIDFFRYTAHESGKLVVRVIFEHDNGNLRLDVFDASGDPIASSNISSGTTAQEEIIIPVVGQTSYIIRVQGADNDERNEYDLEIENFPAPIPKGVYLHPSDDTGVFNNDNVTTDTTPRFFIENDLFDFESMGIPIDQATGPEADVELQIIGANTGTIRTLDAVRVSESLWMTAPVGPALPADLYFVQASTRIRDGANPQASGRSRLSEPLWITIESEGPPISFGLNTNPNDGLHASSDSGVSTIVSSFSDRITNDTTPRFWGLAEAQATVRMYVDVDGDNMVNSAVDIFVGQTTATPYGENPAFADGYWEIESVVDLNSLPGFDRDGVRRLLVTAEDYVGNVTSPVNTNLNPELVLDIFIDTRGPQVYDPDGSGSLHQAIHVTGNPDFNLFAPKGDNPEFTPLVDSLTIHLRDLPKRVTGFDYEALAEQIAEVEANYRVVGDYVGIVDIVDVDFFSDSFADGEVATGRLVIRFANPLPDDRYTITISDDLVDPAGNRLDGESGADEPDEQPNFPSGNRVPGGDFVARFTVDSRPEIGSFVSQHIALDINGNFFWDPSAGLGGDTTNRDLSFTLPAFLNGAPIPGNESPHELLVAGRFTAIGTDKPGARFFDQLATYGNYAGIFRWLIDLDSDGVVFGNLDPDVLTGGINDLIVNQAPIAGFNISGAIPIAGNFDNNPDNGDEIGLYYAGSWAIDTNHDYIIDTVLSGNLFGTPIVGDFDGNGTDDFAVFNTNVFSFGFNLNPFAATSIVWGFPGVLDRPVAADMDQDGIDDIGLWVPRNSAGSSRIIAEWYFLLSQDYDPTDGFNDRGAPGTVRTLNHPFSPVPFGFDIYAEFGDEMAMPIVGNFDPPVAKKLAASAPLAGDYNNDRQIDQVDYLVWKSSYGSTTNLAADGNGDGRVNSADYSIWRNAMDAGLYSPVTSTLAGDYDHNGQVAAQDYSTWKSSYGSSNLVADGNGDGRVNAADYTIWRNNLGNSFASGSGGLAGGSSAALSLDVAEEPVVLAASTELPYFVVTANVEAANASGGVDSSVQSEEEVDSLLLLLAGRPTSDLDEALGDFGVDKVFGGDDSEGEPGESELAIATAWQTWDQL